jgi:hypothetical protein
MGLWNANLKNELVAANGSVQVRVTNGHSGGSEHLLLIMCFAGMQLACAGCMQIHVAVCA